VLEQLMLRSDTPRISADLVAQVLRESGMVEIAPASGAPTRPALLSTPMAAQPIPNLAEGTLVPLAQQIAALEKVAIAQALSATRGNKAAAAQVLGISRAKLYERLESLNVILSE